MRIQLIHSTYALPNLQIVECILPLRCIARKGGLGVQGEVEFQWSRHRSGFNSACPAHDSARTVAFAMQITRGEKHITVSNEGIFVGQLRGVHSLQSRISKLVMYACSVLNALVSAILELLDSTEHVYGSKLAANPRQPFCIAVTGSQLAKPLVGNSAEGASPRSEIRRS